MSLTSNGTTNSSSATLGALNAAVTLDISGSAGAGFTLSAGTLTATFLVEESFDGGINWIVIFLLNPGSATITAGDVVSNPNPVEVRTIVTNPGATHVRVRVSSYTSGSAVGTLFSTLVIPFPLVSYSVNAGNAINPIKSDFGGGLVPAAANLSVTATAATGVGVTLTLPAPTLGNYHYITTIEIDKYFTAANAASGTPLVVTTTNLPGSLAFTFGQPLGTIGTTDSRIITFPSPLKASVINTASTIVCPATTGIIWRVTAYYFLAQ